jgi:predicted O-methyltransferase YrrM
MSYQEELQQLFQKTFDHRITHACGGHPYEHGSVLTALVAATRATKILEVGTALGYTTACLAYGNTAAQITTIDQDAEHLKIAQENWKDLKIENRIQIFADKAEAVLPTLSEQYNFIFFDAYAPQVFMLNHFKRLLKKGGVLVTANLYLKDKTGGKYVRELNNSIRWKTGFFADSSLSVKLFD